MTRIYFKDKIEQNRVPVDYQIVTNSFACLVVVDYRGVIVETAPLLGKFKNQKMAALVRWLIGQFAHYRIYNLTDLYYG